MPRPHLYLSSAVMFEFYSKELFEDTEAEARRYDGVHLSIPSQKQLFINPEIKEAVRDFMMGQQRQLRGV